jgi:glycosyltransferase involved in cell wall biosynthesis
MPLMTCVLIPTYNNAPTLSQLLTDVMQYTTEVCVVNDGSTDSTLEILKQFPAVKVLSYEANKGKGWALRQGFKFALAHGYSHAITIDSDGQHYADDLPLFFEAAHRDSESIYIGARNMGQSGVPGRSSFGNRFSNFWFTLETGIHLPDTQSGYRLYPIALMSSMRWVTIKYEFEIEVIVRGAWAGIAVKSLPIKVYYPPTGERISHFSPFQDFTRISILNSILVIVTYVWIKPRNLCRRIFGKD